MDEPALRALLAALSPVKVIETDPDVVSQLVLVPQDHKIESLESFQESPNRIKACPRLQSAEAFCAYVNRYSNVTGSETAVYLNLDGANFVAVIDHHGKDAPTWGNHTASFNPQESLEWQAWSEINDKLRGQIDFAEFIEANLNDIAIPDAAGVLKAALDFQDKKNFTLASSQNLDDGSVKFHLVNENAAQDITFPHRITLAIPIYENEKPRWIDARIRYRADANGVLSFKVTFVEKADRILRREIEAIAVKLQEEIADVRFYLGVR